MNARACRDSTDRNPLAAEMSRYVRCRRDDCNNDDYRQLLHELQPVTRQRLDQWLTSGSIYDRVAALHRPVNRDLLQLRDPALRDTIADRLLADGERLFREHGLIGGKWASPPEGKRPASLQTYFDNACVLAFSNLERKLIRDALNRPFDDLNNVHERQLPHQEDPASANLRALMVRDALSQLGTFTNSLVRMRIIDGASIRDIAEEHDCTTKAVAAKLHRTRKKLRNMLGNINIAE